MQERRGEGGSGQARLGVVNEETCWARENERKRVRTRGYVRRIRGSGAEEGGVCPGKKSIQSDRDNVFV